MLSFTAKTPFAAAAAFLMFCSCDGTPSSCRDAAYARELNEAKARLENAETTLVRFHMLGRSPYLEAKTGVPLEDGHLPASTRAAHAVRPARAQLDEIMERCAAADIRGDTPP